MNVCEYEGLIKQFLTDVFWGELDYLVVDGRMGVGYCGVGIRL